MISTLAGLLFSFLAPEPVCGLDSAESIRRALHFQINLARLQAELGPVRPDSALCEIAARRARSVAAHGSPDVDLALLSDTTRSIYRLGYRPHHWTQSSLILDWNSSALVQWRELKPDSYRESVLGDFEDVGIGFARSELGPVYSIVFGLRRRTAEWRQAGPLADVAWVRRVVLRQVNALRAERGRRPVRPNEALDSAAQRHAEDMLRRAYYSHRGRDGTGVSGRARAAGFPGARILTENIAKGLFKPDEVVLRWMASRGHRRNILLRGAAEMGVGVAFGENQNGFEVLWVQVLAGHYR